MENEKKNEQQVRLVDLLAVLLRRRRWIYGFLAAGLLCGVSLWVLPLWSGLVAKNFAVEVNLRVAVVPDNLAPYIGASLTDLTVEALQNIDPTVVASIYQTTLKAKSGDTRDSAHYTQEASDLLDRLVITQGKVLPRVSLLLTSEKPGISAFLSALLEQRKVELGESLRSRLERYQKVWKAVEAGSSPGSETAAQTRLLLASSESLATDDGFPFAWQGGVVETKKPPRISRGLLLVLLLATGLVLGVFSALVADAVAEVIKSPEKRKMLADAWKRERP